MMEAMRIKEERGHGRAKQWTAWTGERNKRERRVGRGIGRFRFT